MTRFDEHALVRRVRLAPGSPIEVGAIGATGAIVTVYGDGDAYEVEFCDGEGVTRALLTLRGVDLEPCSLPRAR